jgi:hypothetical protein
LFQLISSRFLTIITLLLPVWCTCPPCTWYCTICTGTEYFLVVLFRFCILSYADSTESVILSCPFPLIPPLSSPYSGASLPTVTSCLSCGPVRYTNSSACFILKILLSPVPSLLCTYYSSRDGVLCLLSLFLLLSTLITLDSFSLFLCPNLALSFAVVTVCDIYNNVSALCNLTVVSSFTAYSVFSIVA